MTTELLTVYVVFIFVLLLVTSILIMGLRLLRTTIESDGLRQLLAEPGDDGAGGKNSFSRTAGAVGAFGLASIFIGIGYWTLYTLFLGEAKELSNMKDLGYYFLSGAALFAPYAFNQLKSIFK